MVGFNDNTGKEWSAIDVVDLRYSIECGLSVAEIACFLRRTDAEVQTKALDLGTALDRASGSARRPTNL